MPTDLATRVAATARPTRRLLQIAATHPAARRYSLARRNLLPRDDVVVAVQGRWAHDRLLALGASPETLLWCPAEPDEAPDDLVAALAAGAGASYRISPKTLARLHPGSNAPDLISVVRLPRWSPAALLKSGGRLLLVADGIEYAGNLGTLVRTVDACGAAGLVLTSPQARLTHPKVFTASRGTVLTTPVVELASVAAARRWLTRAGFSVYVADPDAPSAYGEVPHPPASGRAAFVVGSEGEGVTAGWRDAGVTRVAIPMAGHADSLNVAVSAAILLFDARARLRNTD
jgi:RNA methyltransferase, TrmH family